MANTKARASSRKPVQLLRGNYLPSVAQPQLPLSKEEILSRFRTENFEAWLWMKESPGGTLRNLAEKDQHIKAVWNDVWKQIPPNQRAYYDTYFQSLVAELRRAVPGDVAEETKQLILAKVEEAGDYVRRLLLPEELTDHQYEPQVATSTLPDPRIADTQVIGVVSPVAQNEKYTPPDTQPEAGTAIAPKSEEKNRMQDTMVTAVASPVVQNEKNTSPDTQTEAGTAIASKSEENARMPETMVTAVASPVVKNEEKESPAAQPKVRIATPSKAEEKILNNLKMKKFEEFLWGSGSHVGTLQSLAMTDEKIKPVWDKVTEQIPPGLKELYASYHSMLVFGLSRSTWWDGTRKTKQQILAQVKEADALVALVRPAAPGGPITEAIPTNVEAR